MQIYPILAANRLLCLRPKGSVSAWAQIAHYIQIMPMLPTINRRMATVRGCIRNMLKQNKLLKIVTYKNHCFTKISGIWLFSQRDRMRVCSLRRRRYCHDDINMKRVIHQ